PHRARVHRWVAWRQQDKWRELARRDHAARHRGWALRSEHGSVGISRAAHDATGRTALSRAWALRTAARGGAGAKRPSARGRPGRAPADARTRLHLDLSKPRRERRAEVREASR